jgi:hypothetical protein
MLLAPTTGLYRTDTPYFDPARYYGTRAGSTTIILGLPVRKEDLTPKPPETVTSTVAPAATSWLDGEMIAGVKNTWLALGAGIAAALFFGSKR